jgi:hypothetical protein
VVWVLKKEWFVVFKVLALLNLTLSDDLGGRLKVLASTKLKVETANRQSNNRVRGCATNAIGWVSRLWFT